MYYSNITNEELQHFKGIKAPNFSIKLSSILPYNRLFKIETIVADSIYKIYPLFYTEKITSTNPNDKIMENKCIICQKQDNETFLTFISDESKEISEYVHNTFLHPYNIGDTLSIAQYNGVVSLFRKYLVNKGDISLKQEQTQGYYGKYTFNIHSTTLVDDGILITDETLTNLGTVKLENAVFPNSTYKLRLQVYHITDINFSESDNVKQFIVYDEEDNIETETIEIELVEGQKVTIPFNDFDYSYIVKYDAEIIITHDKPVIHYFKEYVQVYSEKTEVQQNETIEIFAQLKNADSTNYAEEGLRVTFYKNEYDITGKTRIGYGFTNEQGIAKLEYDVEGNAIEGYTGQGEGNITILARTGNGHSNQFDIYDAPSSKHISFKISENNVTVGSVVTLSAKVTIQDEAIADETVSFMQDSNLLGTSVTNEKGIATYRYTTTAGGEIEFSANIGNISSNIKTLTVNKLNTALSINVPQIIYTDVFDITGVLSDVNSNPIANESVQLWTIEDGTSILQATKTTDSNGEVNFHREAITEIDTYAFFLKYNGSDAYNSSVSSTEEKTPSKETSVLTIIEPVIDDEFVTSEDIRVEGTLYTNDGEIIEDATIIVTEEGYGEIESFSVDSETGEFVGTITNDAHRIGTENLTFEFTGNEKYTSSNITISVTRIYPPIVATNTILSKYNSDSTVITVDFRKSGQNVQLYQSTSSTPELIGTMTDNGDGTYSYRYTAQGKGDIRLYATYSRYTSDTLLIEDCDAYFNTSRIGAFPTVTSGSSSFKISNYAVNLDKYTFEFKASGSVQFTIGNKDTWVVACNCGLSSNAIQTHDANGNVATTNNVFDTGADYKVQIIGTTIRVFRNGIARNTFSNRKTTGYATNIRIYPSSSVSRAGYVKVKPL